MQHVHWQRFAALSLLSFAILFQYQNCAPGGRESSGAVANDPSNSVHAMGGDVTALPVQLSSSAIRLTANQTETSVSGTCVVAQTPILSWTLRDPETGEDLAQGSTACLNNGFNLQMTTGQNIECNKVYELHVDEAQGAVTKDCQN